MSKIRPLSLYRQRLILRNDNEKLLHMGLLDKIKDYVLHNGNKKKEIGLISQYFNRQHSDRKMDIDLLISEINKLFNKYSNMPLGYTSLFMLKQLIVDVNSKYSMISDLFTADIETKFNVDQFVVKLNNITIFKRILDPREKNDILNHVNLDGGIIFSPKNEIIYNHVGNQIPRVNNVIRNILYNMLSNEFGIKNRIILNKLYSKLVTNSPNFAYFTLKDYFLAKDISDMKNQTYLSNIRRAKIDLNRIFSTKNWDINFKQLTGKTFIEFQTEIYGEAFKTRQLITVDSPKYKISKPYQRNNERKLVQKSSCITKNGNIFKCETKTIGTDTHSSNAQRNQNIFNDVRAKTFIGINVNQQDSKMIIDNEEGQSIEKNYRLFTVGSYQINDDKSIENATILLKNMTTKKTKFLIDIKPLKLFRTHKDNNPKIFATHTKVMKKAMDRLRNSSTDTTKYIGICGTSFGLKQIGKVPESNYELKYLLKFFKEKIQIEDEDYKIFEKLEALVKDLDNFKYRGKLILIFTLIRILSIKFPDEITIMGGCMSAKDRMGSLTHASNLLIQLYYINGNNLDFISDNGKIIEDKLDDNQLNFIKCHIKNIAGLNILSEMGIGKFNNKNIDLFACVFEKDGLLRKSVYTKNFVKTGA